MNPDKNPLLDNVNTEAAEQTFSWLKQYAQIISNMNHLCTPLFMLTLFHLNNLSRVKRPPSFIFDVVAWVPNVQGVSLSHLADVTMEKMPSSSANVSAATDIQSINTIDVDQLNLPKGLTDWDAIVRDIIYKKGN